jgi:transposase InsO family protein
MFRQGSDVESLSPACKSSAETFGQDEVWAGDVTYLRTAEGWMCLAIVLALYSRRIMGWHIDKSMTTD